MRKVKIHLNRVSFFYSPLRFTAKRVRQSALVFRVKAARNPKGKPNGFAQRSRPITYCTAYLLRSASGTVPGQVSKRGLHLLLKLNTIASPFLFYCWCLRKYILKKVWVVRSSATSAVSSKANKELSSKSWKIWFWLKNLKLPLFMKDQNEADIFLAINQSEASWLA